jgi:hypothetical protein
MHRLTILNHTQWTVEVTINNGAPQQLQPGGRLTQVLNGPVQLHARAISGHGANMARPATSADGLVQDRTLVLEVQDPNTAQLGFRVS